MNRRSFFFVASIALLGITSLPRAVASTIKQASQRFSKAGLTTAQRQMIAAVQEHMLPSELNAPGASDANATGYLQQVLIHHNLDKIERRFIIDGIYQFETFTLNNTGKSFIILTADERESVLRHYETDPAGHQWLTVILQYILEAMLTDPVYGGNTNGVGWGWLQFTPSFKRPSPDKRFFLL